MKIFQLIYTLSSGGAERFVVDLSNELAKTGNEVTLCTMMDNDNPLWGFYRENVSDKVNLVNYKFTFASSILSNLYELFYIVYKMIRLYAIIKKIKPDIVHCHLRTVYYLMPTILIFFLRHGHTHFFYTVHNDAEKEVGSILGKKIRTFFFKRNIITAITISELTSISFIKYYGINNFVQIENGRSRDKKTSLFDTVTAEIQKLSNFGQKTIFLHIARYSKQKNQQLLIDSFNKLLDDNQPVILLIIGRDFFSEQGLALQKKAKEGIYFLEQKRNVVDYYLNADAFCLTSIYEGLPVSILEAISNGCVPVCTPVGGVVNVIQNGTTGYLSDNISIESYSNTIMNYLKHKNHITKESLIQYYNDNYSIEKCAENHIKLYLSYR